MQNTTYTLLYMNKISDFYDRVQNCAKNKKTTVEAVYKGAGLTHSSYYGPKRSKKKTVGKLPRADEVVKIAEILETTVEFLVTGKKQSNMNIEEKKHIYHFLDNLEKTIKEEKKNFK